MTGDDLLRDLMSLDGLVKLAAGEDADLVGEFEPAKVSENFDPSPDVKRMLAGLWHSAEGRETIEWLMDLTVRAPYPVTPQSQNDLAFAAAKHQARAAVGRSIIAAAAHGFQLLNQPKEKAHDETS